MNQIHYSEIESKRFEFNIHRGLLTKVNLEQIQSYLSKHNPDIAILRINASEINACYQLGELDDYQLIFADALVYYNYDLTKISNAYVLRNELEFELLTNDNKDIVLDLVPLIFADYSNHYSANPLLEKPKMIEGYIEWAQSYIHGNISDRISWLVKRNLQVIGFATCSFNSETGVSEGVLYGVHPNHAGGGVYTDIIKYTKNYFHHKGFKYMKVSTQLHNYAVQKVWSREGFVLENAFYTFHLNKRKLR
jgi:hypothetical protein